MKKHQSASEVVSYVQSGQRVFIHGAGATPAVLVQALVEQADRLNSVELIHMHTMGPVPYADPKYAKNFRVANLFVGENVRQKIDYDRVDYLPVFLSEIPLLFRSGRRHLDVALVHVSPPDRHGFCSLGTSVDVAKAAVETADLVLAQVNPRMPRVHGDGLIHISDIDYYVEVDVPLFEHARHALSDVEKAVGRNVASLVEDGATLQVGIGSIPDAVLAALTGHRHLGLHSEMWSDGALELIRAGVIDNSKKSVHPGKNVSAFLMGSQALYEFVHDNPSVTQLVVEYVNHPNVIARNPKVTAINSAVEIDLTGQICADSVGSRIISGVGGQMDFMRGAALSPGGKPIIAVASRSKKGMSRIVPTLKSGAGVVTTRAHVHYVVTEYGIADLYGKTLSERSKELIQIAHPDDRQSLERAWVECHR